MKRREILFLIISAFILVTAWIGFSIYHNAATSTIPQALNVQIAPIRPVFDMQTFEKLKKREKVSPVFEIRKSLPESPAGTAPASLASPSASQSSTQGGSLLP